MMLRLRRWPPWSPPNACRKFNTAIVVRKLTGLKNFDNVKNLRVEVMWKGQKGIGLKRSVRRNLTYVGSVVNDGVVEWNEEFENVCSFLDCKDGYFQPWEVSFTVCNESPDQQQKSNNSVIGTASVNIAEFAFSSESTDLLLKMPVILNNSANQNCPLLLISLCLLGERIAQESREPTSPLSSSPNSVLAVEFDKIYVSSHKRKNTNNKEETTDGTLSSVKSDDIDCVFSLDTDTFGEDTERELEENKEELDIRPSSRGETVLYARCAEVLCPAAMADGRDETWIYYSYRRSDEGYRNVENASAYVPKKSSWLNPKSKFLAWRKRKFSFKAAKAKGEPLLKKYYGEEGGDDIDYDRRQFSSSDESFFQWSKSNFYTTSCSEFGDDVFVVGRWVLKDIVSRDGQMKLQTKVFFASIDQRSERAAGESACTALVVVIADWFQSNRGKMPIKCELDRLIREGSSEWRNLCENEVYKERFYDKHFDPETIIEAKICPLTVVQTFVGFFHPEGLEDGKFDFLHGSESFDSIWEEINRHALGWSYDESLVYIVSWNDHFFILKVEEDAFYIIDTLGERLYEGCNQAYILKFDKDTTICRIMNENSTSDAKNMDDKTPTKDSKETTGEDTLSKRPKESGNNETDEVVYTGKESCKQYIKSFLAAIPIKELLADVKKGLKASTQYHRQLQIEFHCTKSLQLVSNETRIDGPITMIETTVSEEATTDAPVTAMETTRNEDFLLF